MPRITKPNYTTLEELPLAMSAQDIARAIGVKYTKAYELLHSKELPTYKIGKKILCKKEDFLQWRESLSTGR